MQIRRLPGVPTLPAIQGPCGFLATFEKISPRPYNTDSSRIKNHGSLTVSQVAYMIGFIRSSSQVTIARVLRCDRGGIFVEPCSDDFTLDRIILKKMKVTDQDENIKFGPDYGWPCTLILVCLSVAYFFSGSKARLAVCTGSSLTILGTS